MTRTLAGLPPLAPILAIDRLLTGPEYYHAAVGRHPGSILRSREVVSVIEGELDADANLDWASALAQAAAANPGCRLRLVGLRQRARWLSDGAMPALRFLPDQVWDGYSSTGDEFIYATPLSLEAGPCCELIIVGRQSLKVIFRVSHAVMDGLGAAHFLAEIFRALRGEPLLGSNASFTDIELARHLPKNPPPARSRHRIPPLMAEARSDEPGGIWKRITLPGPQPHLQARIIHAIADYCQRSHAQPARIAIPVSLKRHVPDLHATTNFTSMLYLTVTADESTDSIRRRIAERLAQNADANYPWIVELIRYLPLHWLDRLVTVNKSSYRNPYIAETALVTNLGSFKRTIFAAPGFHATTAYGLPQKENAFITLIGFQNRFEVLVGMYKVFANEGRLDDFMAYLQHHLAQPA